MYYDNSKNRLVLVLTATTFIFFINAWNLPSTVYSVAYKRKMYAKKDNTSWIYSKPASPSKLIESKDVSKIVQSIIRDLQNPVDCKAAKKILCLLPKHGLGCQAQHLIVCLTIGFYTRRTVIILSKASRYSENGWESLMLPISKTCANKDGNQTAVKVENLKGIENISMIEIRYGQHYIKLTDALPPDLYLRIKRFHSIPPLWWAGQIALYAFKPTDNFRSFLQNRRRKLGLVNNFVGVHIRRTDKIKEAEYKNISEYMEAVDQWYQVNGKRDVPRQVFLASDDPDVVRDVKERYPNYIFINDINATVVANDKRTRYSLQSLKYTIQDIYFLSMSDFLVCTLSSNVCQLAFELMQTRFENASRNVKSLDRCYHIFTLTRDIC